MAALPLIVFDVNETLLDLETMEPTFRAHRGGLGGSADQALWQRHFGGRPSATDCRQRPRRLCRSSHRPTQGAGLDSRLSCRPDSGHSLPNLAFVQFASIRLWRRVKESPPLMNLPLLAGPVRLAQLALEDLAGRVARQRIDEIDRARHLVAGDTLAGVQPSAPRA